MSATTILSAHAAENLLFFTLLQLVIILLAARLGGSLARRLGQARVVGEIIVGLLLGPSLFGVLARRMETHVLRPRQAGGARRTAINARGIDRVKKRVVRTGL